MADNIVLNAGTGGATLAADDITSVWYQLIKLAYGALDSATLVTTSAGLPVQQQGNWVLAANSGVDIGDVDVTSVIPGVGATNLGKAIDTAAGATDTGIGALAIRDDALGALTPIEGDWVGLRVDANGALWVHDDALDAALGGSELQVDVVAALPAGTNNIGDVDVLSIIPGTGATNLGKAIDTAAGATDTGVAALVVRDDALSALTPIEGDFVALRVDANGALWTHDDALDAALAGSELQVDVVAALPAGTNAIGKLAANSGVDIGDVDILSIAAGSNLIADVGIQGRTTGGLSFFKSIDLDETEEEVKGAAGTLYGFYAYSNVAAGTKRFLKIYNNTAVGVTVGTTAVDLTFELDGTQGMVFNVAQGLAFGTGITAAVTTAVADTDTGAPGANDVLFMAWFK